MTADPNWFYSTLAQSSAAIVGLTGGFLVQRVLAQRSEISSKRFDVEGNLEASFAKVDQFRRELERVASSCASVAAELAAAAGSGSDAVQLGVETDVAYFERAGVRGTRGTAERVPTSLAGEFAAAGESAEQALRSIPADFQEYARTLKRRGGLGTGPEWLEKEPRSSSVPMSAEGVASWLPHQSDLIRRRWSSLQREAIEPAREYARLRAQAVPRSLYSLIAVLALFLMVGVVAPLFYLSPGETGSRNLLLVAFVPLCFAFVAYVGFELAQLRRSVDLSLSRD